MGPFIFFQTLGKIGHEWQNLKTLIFCNLRYALFHKQRFYKQREGWNWQKIKQLLSNTLSLNFCYLKIIHILYPSYRLKIIKYIIKKDKRTSVSVFTRLHVNPNVNEDENEK